MLVCPYCYSQFDKKDILYRCENPDDTACPKENDAPLASYFQQATFDAKRVFPAKKTFGWGGRKIAQKVNCTRCKRASTKKICPSCHNELPSSFHTTSSHIISIVGARNSGKSTYITVLIDELQRNGYKLDLAVLPQDVGENPNEVTSKRYQNRYKKILMEDYEELPQTPESEKDLYPLIYKVSTGQNRFLKNSSLYLALYDTAGESLKDRSKLEKLAKYVRSSSGVIFLLDTFEIRYVHDQLRKKLPGGLNRKHIGAYGEVIHQIIQDIQRNDRLLTRSLKDRFFNKDKKVAIPSAVVFNKLDVIIENDLLSRTTERLLSEDSHFLKSRKLDPEKVEEVSSAIFETLCDWKEEGFGRNLQKQFANHKYFAVSSLGPRFHGLPADEREIIPCRVLDPLVWILDQIGFALPK